MIPLRCEQQKTLTLHTHKVWLDNVVFLCSTSCPPSSLCVFISHDYMSVASGSFSCILCFLLSPYLSGDVSRSIAAWFWPVVTVPANLLTVCYFSSAHFFFSLHSPVTPDCFRQTAPQPEFGSVRGSSSRGICSVSFCNTVRSRAN